LNGLVRFAERQNLASARVPSHFNWLLPSSGKKQAVHNMLLDNTQERQKVEVITKILFRTTKKFEYQSVTTNSLMNTFKMPINYHVYVALVSFPPKQ
jgi:hypothetical protein